MKFPNLLATRNGRLATFFLLYITEGIPYGFVTIAMATQLRRQGGGVADISSFTAAIFTVWGLKWVVGPIVDVLSSNRFGRRRIWILCMQVGMVASLFLLQAVGLHASINTLIALVIVHNIFAATQDVAIDALAVGTLKEDERGMAGGLTFAGSYLGQIIGGAGSLFLVKYIGFGNTFFFVAASILTVTVLVVLPLKEPMLVRAAAAGTGLQRIGGELRQFVRDVWDAFTASRASLVGLLFAVMPAGAMGLGLALAQTLAVDLGFDDDRVATWNLWTTVGTIFGCVIGGWLSDRIGRRRSLAWFISSMTPITLWLAWSLWQSGWIHPVDPGKRAALAASAAIVSVFWISSLLYTFANGLMYGARAAMFMDVSNPRVAATQFTAYMSLMNLGIAVSSWWLGKAVEHYGYPQSLLADAFIGLLCLIFLAAMGPIAVRKSAAPAARLD